jgi:hypothetical protein
MDIQCKSIHNIGKKYYINHKIQELEYKVVHLLKTTIPNIKLHNQELWILEHLVLKDMLKLLLSSEEIEREAEAND